MEEPSGPWDPGLQVERTALAWSRTWLALLAIALLTLKVTSASDVLVQGGIAVAAGTVSLSALRRSSRRHREFGTALRSSQPQPHARLLAALAAGVAAVGMIGLAALVT